MAGGRSLRHSVLLWRRDTRSFRSRKCRGLRAFVRPSLPLSPFCATRRRRGDATLVLFRWGGCGVDKEWTYIYSTQLPPTIYRRHTLRPNIFSDVFFSPLTLEEEEERTMEGMEEREPIRELPLPPWTFLSSEASKSPPPPTPPQLPTRERSSATPPAGDGGNRENGALEVVLRGTNGDWNGLGR